MYCDKNVFLKFLRFEIYKIIYVFVRYVIVVLVSPYTHCPCLIMHFQSCNGCTLLIRKKNTAYYGRILPLRI